MTMLLNSFKTIALIFYCLILQSTIAFPLFSTTLLMCNCIHKNDCVNELLLNADEQNIYEIWRSAVCEYHGPRLLICCQILGRNIAIPTKDVGSWMWGSEAFRAEETTKLDVTDVGNTQIFRKYRPLLSGATTKQKEKDDDDDEKRFYETHQFLNLFQQEEHKLKDAATAAVVNDGFNIDGRNILRGHKFTIPFEAENTDQPKIYSSFESVRKMANSFVPQENYSVPMKMTVLHPVSLSSSPRSLTIMTNKTEAPPIIQLKNTLANTNSLINSPNCGISVERRIIGGIEGQNGQFPWIIRLGYINTTSNQMSYRCSGSIISEQYILTAAHCVTNLVTNLKLDHVLIGDKDVSASCLQNACHTEQMYTIEKVTIHNKYDKPKYAHDIALLHINRSNPISQENYDSICLPAWNDTSLPAIEQSIKTGVVAGWSTNKDGVEIASSTSVKYLRLPIVNTTECALKYARYSENFKDPIVITSSQLCAQGQPRNDVCRGDSGGPLMDDGSNGVINTSGRYTLLGIVAFGPTICGSTKFPGVYTRVSSYIDWIVANINI